MKRCSVLRFVLFFFIGGLIFIQPGFFNSAEAVVRADAGKRYNSDGNTAAFARTATSETELNLTGTTITMEAWVYVTESATTSGSRGILSKANVDLFAPEYGIGLKWQGDNKVLIYTTIGGTSTDASTTHTVDDSTWHHIAATYDISGGPGTGILKVFFDGVPESVSTSLSLTLSSQTWALVVGAFSYTGAGAGISSFRGAIDDVRVSSGIEHSADFSGSLVTSLLNTTNSVCLYKFNAVANDGTDTTGSGNLTANTLSIFAGGSVTFVELSYFKAIPKDNKIVLKWKTDSETDNAGFNILRSGSKNSGYSMINNDEFIYSEANDAVGGAKYRYPDVNVKAGKKYFYKLVDIDIDGDENVNKPNPKAKIKKKNKRQKKHKKK